MNDSQLTAEQLRQIMPHCPKAIRAEQLPLINQTLLFYGITTELRAAAFLATLAAESGEFKYRNELASGASYEGRRDLGNTKPGDGRRFKGHGRIQVTGRANHAAYTEYLRERGHLPFVDFVAHPDRLTEDPYALDSAGWFWSVYKKLNPLADARKFLATQIRVNGRMKATGLPNHWEERKAYYERALRVLPDDFNMIEVGHRDRVEVEDEESADVDDPVEASSVADAPDEDRATAPRLEPPTKIALADEAKEVAGGVGAAATAKPPESPNATQAATAPIPVPQAVPAKDAPSETLAEKAGKTATQIKAWYVAIPAAVIQFGVALYKWATDPAHTLLVMVLLVGVVLIVGIFVVMNYRHSNEKKRVEEEAAKRDHELKMRREQQAFELTKLQALSAARRDQNAVTIVPQPLENSDPA